MDKLLLESFIANLAKINERIAQACKLAHRQQSEVSLLPVTKTHGIWAIEYALNQGFKAIGENRVQEVKEKKPQILGQDKLDEPAKAGYSLYSSESAKACQWDLIGHLQSNKAKEAVQLFDRIQSVDSIKLLNKLNNHAEEAGKKLPILLQCNAGEDPNKYGFAKNQMEQALEQALKASSLKVEGLMTIAPLDDNPDRSKACFETLSGLRDALEAQFDVELKELSMGMTQDLESAIKAGSTMIRVGTALFGSRS